MVINAGTGMRSAKTVDPGMIRMEVAERSAEPGPRCRVHPSDTRLEVDLILA